MAAGLNVIDTAQEFPAAKTDEHVFEEIA